MPVKVIDQETQQEIEVSAADAQKGVQQGRFMLPEATVRVARGSQRATIPTDKLLTALGQGGRLIDADEDRAMQISGEETDVGSTIQGAAEAAAAGLTLGGSTWVEANLLGGDPERMKARREGLGTLATALEVGGAIAPAFVTGGGSVGVQAGGRGLLGTAARLSPAGRMAELGLGVERGLGATLGPGGGLVRSVVPMAGRGAAEGFVAQIGANLDDSVLDQDRELTAERLLEGAPLAALLGGGAGSVIPGLAYAGSGLGRMATKPMQQVLGKASGFVDELGDKGLASVLASPTARKTVSTFGAVPLEEVDEVFDAIGRDAVGTNRALTDGARVTEEIADGVRAPIQGWQDGRKFAVRKGSGEARMRSVEQHLPRDNARLATIQEQSFGRLDDLDAKLGQAQQAIAEGASSANAPSLVAARRLVKGARRGIRSAIDEGQNLRQIAAVTHRELDGLSQGLREIRQRASSMARGFESEATLDAIAPLHDDIRAFLSNDGRYAATAIWDEAGRLHGERNKLMAQAIAMQDDARGSAGGRLLDGERGIDNADLLTLVRDSATFRGGTRTEKFLDAIEAENRYMRWVLEHGDIDDVQRAELKAQIEASGKINEAFDAQRAKVRTVETLNRWKTIEGNASVSTGILTNPATAIMAGAGGLLGGLPGAILGGALAQITRPHALARKLAAIQARLTGAERESTRAIAGTLKRLGKGAAKAIGAVGSGVSTATRRLGPQLGVDRDKHLEQIRKRTQMLAANPGLLAGELAKMTIDLDEDAPRLSQAVAAKAHQAAIYLAGVAPRGYDPDPMKRGRNVMYAPEDLESYARRVEAATDPRRALGRISDGTLTREHVEALKAVWPAEFDWAQRQVFDALSSYEGDVPLDLATQISTLFDAPFDPTLPLAQGMRLAWAQGAAQAQAQQQQSRGAKPPKLEIDSGRYDTAMDAATKASSS